MNESLTLDINNIQIIVHKTEEANFIYDNPGRIYDGFVMVTSGSGYVTDSKGQRYAVSKGDMVITSFGDKYVVEFEEPCSYVTSGLTLDTDKKLLPFIHKCTKGQYKRIVDICKIWQSRSWDSYAECRIGLMQFYLEVIQNSTRSDSRDDFVLKAISFIHENFKTNFSGKDISAYCSVSLSYLRSTFLIHTGKTIGAYRDSLRIAAAKEMLESKYFTVTEIAAELGYCDVYHFSKVFTARVGCPPTKWINQK